MIISPLILLIMRNISEKCVAEIKKFIVINFFSKIVQFMSYVEKYCRSRRATCDNIMLRRRDSVCMPYNRHTLIIFVEFDVGDFIEICRETRDLITIARK
jgi:hypothetical protein